MFKHRNPELSLVLKDHVKDKYADILSGQETKQATWYLEANEFGKAISKGFDVPLFVSLGVLAALSPRNKWERNKIDAYNLIRKPTMKTKTATFNANKEKALKIIREATDADSVIKILKGRKIVNFFKNLMLMETMTAVTVDIWMFSAASLKPTDKNYDIIEQAILELSEETNFKPYEIQEIIWEKVRSV